MLTFTGVKRADDPEERRVGRLGRYQSYLLCEHPLHVIWLKAHSFDGHRISRAANRPIDREVRSAVEIRSDAIEVRTGEAGVQLDGGEVEHMVKRLLHERTGSQFSLL